MNWEKSPSLSGTIVGNSAQQANNSTTGTQAGGAAVLEINGQTQNQSEIYMATANIGNGGGIAIDMYINGVQGSGQIYIGGTNGISPVITINANGAGGGRQIGFFGAAPIAQPAAIAAPAGGATIDAQARTAITSILAVLGAAAGGYGLTA